jgi:D-alanyl-lipoteichoic acid acyltransferase DltB (MBOAT superfamily)
MLASSLDLGAPLFWCFAGAAVLLIGPITQARLRWLAIAALDLAFIALLVGPRPAALAIGFAVAVHVAGQLAGRGLRPTALFCAAGVLLLFLVHKLRPLAPANDLARMLVAVGYSYVALRSLELLRCAWEGTHAPPDLARTVAYLFPFHMLAAGPIQSYAEFAAQPDVPEKVGLQAGLEGADLIARGLFKKYVLAQAVDAVFLTGFRAEGAYFWLEVQAFYVWVYLDFSAYSDIALGAGRLVGIATPHNFDRPLAARNLTEFWERWHVSLSQFIRRNLFIPLQLFLMRRTEGARPLLVASLAFTASFILCGLWHGLSLRFLAWGAVHAAGLVICNLYRHALRAWLGRASVAAYAAHPGVRLIATALTFEYVALSLAFVAHAAPGAPW